MRWTNVLDRNQHVDTHSVCTMFDPYNYTRTRTYLPVLKGKVVLLGDFNAGVGRSAQIDDVVGMFGENTCNASGNDCFPF